MLAPLAAQQATEKVELKLKLPKPMFIGTPTNIKSANLEAVTGKSRAPFMVPVGTKLLSLKKPVTSSDTQPVIGELDMITDGEKEGGDGYFVELGPGQAVGPDRSGRVVRAPRDPGLALPQPGARLPRRRRPGVRRQGLPEGRADDLQQRPRQHARAWASGKDKEYIEVAEGRLFDPKGVEGPLRPDVLERQHDQRPEPLRRNRGLRHAGEMTGTGVGAVIPPETRSDPVRTSYFPLPTSYFLLLTSYSYFLYGFVITGSSPAPGMRAAQSNPRLTSSRASGTSKSATVCPSVQLKTRPLP